MGTVWREICREIQAGCGGRDECVLCMYVEGWVFVYVCLSMCMERFGCECGGRNGYEYVSERLGCTFAWRDEGVCVWRDGRYAAMGVCAWIERCSLGLCGCVFEK